MQTNKDVAATAREKVSGGHSAQPSIERDPAADLYVPAGHAVHSPTAVPPPSNVAAGTEPLPAPTATGGMK